MIAPAHVHEPLLIEGTPKDHQIAVPNEVAVSPPKQTSLAIEQGLRGDENKVVRHTTANLEYVTLDVRGPMKYAVQQRLLEAVVEVEVLDGD